MSVVDVADVDINSDGVVDQVELGKYLDTRDAADFLTLADTDGRHVVYLECLATKLMTNFIDFVSIFCLTTQLMTNYHFWLTTQLMTNYCDEFFNNPTKDYLSRFSV